MTVYKNTITLVILSKDEPYNPDGMKDLNDIAYDLSDGDIIGTWWTESNEVVPEDRVRDELIAVGNDGDFFDDDWGWDDDSDG